jgi:hypothetical protein
MGHDCRGGLKFVQDLQAFVRYFCLDNLNYGLHIIMLSDVSSGDVALLWETLSYDEGMNYLIAAHDVLMIFISRDGLSWSCSRGAAIIFFIQTSIRNLYARHVDLCTNQLEIVNESAQHA